MLRKKLIQLVSFVPALLLLQGCFADKGNYEYHQVNEAVIGGSLFDTTVEAYLNETVLDISPEISFTLDKDASGNYEYEWVAVGQNFLRGQRFTLSRERNLHYKVALAAEEYILYYKVKDLDTDLVFSRSLKLNVRSAYSVGWVLAGENSDGIGQVDMLSYGAERKIFHNCLIFNDGLGLSPAEIVWIDNDEWTSEPRLYVGCPEGTYKFDRESFAGSPYTSLRASFALEPEGKCVMSDSQKISDKRHVIIVDGRAYVVSSDGGMVGNTFSVDANGVECDTAPRMMCNHKDRDVRMFIFYDQSHKRFSYISGLTVKELIPMPDGEGDEYSYDTSKDFASGLDFVTALNSFFGRGQSIAVMNNPEDNSKWIYCFVANNGGDFTKQGRYKVDKSIVQDFDSASCYLMTTNHGYLLYSVGEKLYACDFRSTPQKCVLLRTFDAPITCLKADNESPDKLKDYFFVATYDDAAASSGVLWQFSVVDSPDRMEISQLDCIEGNFLKINSICRKEF